VVRCRADWPAGDFHRHQQDRFANGVMVEADVEMGWLDVLEQLGAYPKTNT
jgi:hypothetical protein